MTVAKTRVTFAAGDVLAQPGQAVDKLYLIHSGTVSVHPENAKCPAFFGPGTVVGLLDVVEGKSSPKFHASIIVVDAIDAEELDAVDVAQQIRALSPRLRVCLVSMLRSGIRILESNEQTEERMTRVVRKARRDLDALVRDQRSDTAGISEADLILTRSGL